MQQWYPSCKLFFNKNKIVSVFHIFTFEHTILIVLLEILFLKYFDYFLLLLKMSHKNGHKPKPSFIRRNEFLLSLSCFRWVHFYLNVLNNNKKTFFKGSDLNLKRTTIEVLLNRKCLLFVCQNTNYWYKNFAMRM